MLVISRFGFEGRIWVLIALVPVHCLLVALRNSGFIILSRQTNKYNADQAASMRRLICPMA